MEKSWYKLKDDKKAELVNAFNAIVLSGTEKPHTTTSYTVIVKDLKWDTIETIIYAMTINGVEYTFPCYCVNGVNFYYCVQGAT